LGFTSFLRYLFSAAFCNFLDGDLVGALMSGERISLNKSSEWMMGGEFYGGEAFNFFYSPKKC
jgi:hypothetical protein